MHQVHHRYATVAGHRVFYREAGSPDSPALVLLHGFPTSSFMFRELVPELAGDYHVIAPDYLGFGLSDAPTVDEFSYSFDGLTDIVEGLLDQLGLSRYGIYVQDYGAPVGWRLALRHPEAITAVITQNGNGYAEGFVEEFWRPIRLFWANRTAETEAPIRAANTLEAIRWQYLTGEPDASLVSPEAWEHDAALVGRPGNAEIQLALMADYANNPPLYPSLHAWLRERQVPVLAVWGRHDPIFGPDGARAFARDTAAEVHLIEAAHFALESAGDEIAELMREFLARKLERPTPLSGR